MNGKRTPSVVLWIAAVAFLLCFGANANAQQPLQASISPRTVAIGSFYDGATVTVTGEAPADAEVVVRLIGKRHDLHLKKKGKVFGLLWMNLDTKTFEDVPNVYMLYSSVPFEKLLGTDGASSAAWKLGLSSLEEGTKILPETSDRKLLFDELLKLKQSEGLYAVRNDKVRYLKTSGDQRSFETALEIPARVAPGQYTVETYAVKDGNIVAQASQGLNVQLDGFPAMLSVLAFQHGAIFGVLATLIAIFAGLIMGFVFGSGKGGH
jgi:uncharacterized protein (TIGR02186 family)